MTTKIIGSQITDYTINTDQLSNTAVATFAKTLAPKITTVNVSNSSFTTLDDTAVNIGGGYIVITGAEFQTGASVLIDTTPATSVSYINSTTLHAQIPAKSAASYNLYVVNPDGGTGIRVAGVTYSSSPTWVTESPLPNQLSEVSFNVALSATGASSYSNVTELPAGTELLSNGYFYGTITVGAETQYTFDVKAEDAELQDSTKTFQVTVTLAPTYYFYSWGFNSKGQLGNDTAAINASSPIQIGTSKWSSLLKHGKGGSNFGMLGGIKDDGTLWLWGDNSYGKLGVSDTLARSSPVQVGSLTDWLTVATTYRGRTVAVKTNGTLWSWGSGSYGLSGRNAFFNDSSPVQIGTGTNWSSVDTGEHFILALKTDGTIWSWGYNGKGQLGLNLNGSALYAKSSPTQIGTGTTWSVIAAGNISALARKTDGTIWSWGSNYGDNNNGQLGLNDQESRSSPTQIGTSTDWSENFSVGKFSMMIVKNDGTLWTWGGGGWSGVFGLNNSSIVAISSPTKVGTSTDWNIVSLGAQQALSVKTDGTLWGWGGMGQGQLGLNQTGYRSSPIQIGSENTWNLVSAATYTTSATKST